MAARTETTRIGEKPVSLGAAMHQDGSRKDVRVPDDLFEAMKQGDKGHKIGFRDKKENAQSLRHTMRQG